MRVAAAPDLAIGALLRQSWELLRAHPVVAAAMGGALLVSLALMLFGVGALVAPWFVLELFGLQLAVLTGRPVIRDAGWIRAGVFVLGMVGVVAAATWVAVLAFGPDVSTADSASTPLPWPDAVGRVIAITGVTAVAISFIAPFAYAPLILLDRGGSMGAAALESAWLVRAGGLFRHWALVFLAHLVPLLPALLAAVVVARTFERAATPLGVLAGLPLVPLSIPLGQGLLSAAYVARHRELSEPRWARAEAKPSRGLTAALVGLVLAPIASVLMIVIGTLRPAPPSPMERGPEPADVVLRVDGERVVRVPGTTVEVEVEGARVSVRAGDGARSPVPAAWRGSIEEVSVRRRGEHYVIGLSAGDAWWKIKLDRAGTRVDDTVGARLAARLPLWGLVAVLLAFALSGLLLVRALAPLGAVRRLYGAPATARPPLDVLRARRGAAARRAWWVAAALGPVAVAALVAGALSLVGGS